MPTTDDTVFGFDVDGVELTKAEHTARTAQLRAAGVRCHCTGTEKGHNFGTTSTCPAPRVELPTHGDVVTELYVTLSRTAPDQTTRKRYATAALIARDADAQHRRLDELDT